MDSDFSYILGGVFLIKALTAQGLKNANLWVFTLNETHSRTHECIIDAEPKAVHTSCRTLNGFHLFCLSESETRQQSEAVLHAASCGWWLPGQEAPNRQCESREVSSNPDVCVNTLCVTTVKHRNLRPRLQETFIVNGFFCVLTLLWPHPTPLHAPQQLTHSSDTFLDWGTMGLLWYCG